MDSFKRSTICCLCGRTGKTSAKGDMEQRGRGTELLICQREEQRRGHDPLHPQDGEKTLGEVRPPGAD